jgi:hypothetical protein
MPTLQLLRASAFDAPTVIIAARAVEAKIKDNLFIV